MKIVLLGSTGMLGTSLKKYLSYQDFEVICPNFRLNTKDRISILNKHQPDIVLNTIGLTDVDFCESNPHEAYLSNVKTIEDIVSWIKKDNRSHLIHISTDHLYDSSPINYEEKITLKNHYAFSKYFGESVASTVRSTILRTNFFGKSENNKESFTDWIYNSVQENKKIKIFQDVYFSPLSISTLSSVISRVIVTQTEGIFNLGSSSGMSKAEFIIYFCNLLNKDYLNYQEINYSDLELKTPRPRNMIMSSQKIENTLEITLPTLQDEIKRVTGDYKDV